jgi:hypothetical protein
MNGEDICTALIIRQQYLQLKNSVNIPVISSTGCGVGGGTLAQMQMRRKYDALKHKQNASLSYTKNTNYAVLSQKSTTKAQSYRICAIDNYGCWPSSSSDVPGPIVSLCYDASIAYINLNANPGDAQTSELTPSPFIPTLWQFPQTTIQIPITGNKYVTFATVSPGTNAPIADNNTQFSFSIPYTIAFTGIIDISATSFTLIATPNFTLQVLYGNNTVYTPPLPAFSIVSQSISYSTSGHYHISYSSILTIPNFGLEAFPFTVYTFQLSSEPAFHANSPASLVVDYSCVVIVDVTSLGFVYSPHTIESTTP